MVSTNHSQLTTNGIGWAAIDALNHWLRHFNAGANQNAKGLLAHWYDSPPLWSQYSPSAGTFSTMSIFLVAGLVFTSGFT